MGGCLRQPLFNLNYLMKEVIIIIIQKRKDFENWFNQKFSWFFTNGMKEKIELDEKEL